MASLIIVEGEQAGAHYQLGKRTLTGGRDPAREIQIVDPQVSRKHFQIRGDDPGHVIVEMKSLNGVHVNGTRISGQQRLQDGDRIQVGNTILIYQETDDPDRTNALNKYRQAGRELRDDRTIRR
jgi:pSer/pThr/pTyr-binding forkhead associated (FHA) protein